MLAERENLRIEREMAAADAEVTAMNVNISQAAAAPNVMQFFFPPMPNVSQAAVPQNSMRNYLPLTPNVPQTAAAPILTQLFSQPMASALRHAQVTENAIANEIPAAYANRRVNFSGIEFAIPEYTGEDRSHDVHDFFNIFDNVMNSVTADDTFRLIALRRKLKKAAGCLSYVPEAISYAALKRLVIAEFGNKLTLAEAERLLRSRRWAANESMRFYVLDVDRLRRRLDTNRFTETEFVDLIIDGLADVENSYLLLGANTTKELKSRIDRYEHRLTRNAPAANASRSQQLPKPKNTTSARAPAISHSVTVPAVADMSTVNSPMFQLHKNGT